MKQKPLRSVNTNVHVAATSKDKIKQCLHKRGHIVGAKGGGVAQWLGRWICSLEVLSNPPPCQLMDFCLFVPDSTQQPSGQSPANWDF